MLNINTSEAIRHLELLGYSPEDKIYLADFVGKPQSFYPNVPPRRWELALNNFPSLKQDPHKGLYIVVNGQGHKDIDVLFGRAVFIEHDLKDGLTKEEQKNLWQNLGLPEPTFQNETRNSVHQFWVFKEPVAIDNWKELTVDLINFTGADKANKNPSRVMRLAGSWHIGKDDQGNDLEPFQNRIIAESGRRYSYDELRSAVPKKEIPVKPVNTTSYKPSYTPRTYSSSISFSSGSIPPLEYFLSSENQKSLTGIPEGERFRRLQALAADLNGTPKDLDAKGIQYSGDGHALFVQAYVASGCDGKKEEQTWQAFANKNCTPAIGSDRIDRRLHLWRYNNDPEYARESKRKWIEEQKKLNPRFVPESVYPDDAQISEAEFKERYTFDDDFEIPSTYSTNLYFPRVTLEQWQLIATNNNLFLPDLVTIDSDFTQDVTNEFWQWVKENNVTTSLTVGDQTAKDLIKLGNCAIGFNNVYSGVKTSRNDLGELIGKPQLNSELKPFLKVSREFVICFDSPRGYKALDRRFKATTQLSYLLTNHNSVPSIIENLKSDLSSFLNNPKTLDFANILKSRIDVERLQYNWRTDITKLPDVIKVQGEQYFSIEGYEERIAQSNLILFVGNQGTGKTEIIGEITTTLKAQSFKAFATTHRVQLGLALSDRLGIPYIDDSEGDGDIACIDSRHPKGRANIDPRYFENQVLFIYDEIEQVLNHTFSSSTCDEERAGILKELKENIPLLINNGGKIILADANLTPKTVYYLEQIAGEKLKKVIFCNDYQPKKESTVFYFDNVDFWLTELDKQISEGQKIYIFDDAQKIKSLKGTTNLGSYLQKKYPKLKVLIVDRETVADPNHEAYGITKRLHDLKNYDVVLASTVLETGVSIIFKDENQETLKHFNSVFTISNGGLPTNTVIQGSQRPRGQIDIYLYVVKTSRFRLEGGSTFTQQISNYTNQKTQIHITQLNKLADDYTGHNPHKDWYIENCAQQNYEYKHYREIILEGYERLGYTTKLFTNEAIEKVKESKNDLEEKKDKLREYRTLEKTELSPLEDKLKALESTLGIPPKSDELLELKDDLVAAEKVIGLPAKKQERAELEADKEETKKVISSLANELKALEDELGITAKLDELAETRQRKKRRDLKREIDFRRSNNPTHKRLTENLKGLKEYSQYLARNIKSLTSEINFRILNNPSIQSLLDKIKDLTKEINFRAENNPRYIELLGHVKKVQGIYKPPLDSLSKQIKNISGEYDAMIEKSQNIREALKENAEANYEVHLDKVMEAEDISPEYYKLLRNKKELTKNERHSLKKATVSDLFKQQPSKQLITYLDDKIYPKWQLHYFSTVGYTQLVDRDLHKLDALSYEGLTPFQPDVNKSLLSGKVKLLKDINIEFLLTPESKFTKGVLADWTEQAKPYLPAFNNVFGTNISAKASNVVIAQSVLKSLELNLKATSRKKNKRIYELRGLDDGRLPTFELWLEAFTRDKEITEQEWRQKQKSKFTPPCQTFPIYIDESVAPTEKSLAELSSVESVAEFSQSVASSDFSDLRSVTVAKKTTVTMFEGPRNREQAQQGNLLTTNGVEEGAEPRAATIGAALPQNVEDSGPCLADAGEIEVGTTVKFYPERDYHGFSSTGVVQSIEGSVYKVVPEGYRITFPFAKENLIKVVKMD